MLRRSWSSVSAVVGAAAPPLVWFSTQERQGVEAAVRTRENIFRLPRLRIPFLSVQRAAAEQPEIMREVRAVVPRSEAQWLRATEDLVVPEVALRDRQR